MSTTHEDFTDLVSAVEVEFGIVTRRVTRLGGEVDLNLKVECADGSRFLIKATEIQGDSDTSWQGRILDHVAQCESRIPVPKVLRTHSGCQEISVQFNDAQYQVRVMTWLDGEVIGRAVGVDCELLGELGALAGLMFDCLQSADRTGVPKTHHWDVRNLREAVASCVDFVPDPINVGAVATILEKCEPVEPLLAKLPTGLVHQDLNDFNVLVAEDADGRLKVSGIIDFGDTLDSIRVAEVVVAGAYSMLRQPDPVAALAAVVAGFNSVVPLTELERSVIFPLAAARLCLNACTWTKRTIVDQGPYGVSRMMYTWPAVQLLAPLDPAQVLERIEIACQGAGLTNDHQKNGQQP
jgi:Ser/Thr protein kinase RdoA (MazF antagonist)